LIVRHQRRSTVHILRRNPMVKEGLDVQHQTFLYPNPWTPVISPRSPISSTFNVQWLMMSVEHSFSPPYAQNIKLPKLTKLLESHICHQPCWLGGNEPGTDTWRGSRGDTCHVLIGTMGMWIIQNLVTRGTCKVVPCHLGWCQRDTSS